MAALNSNKTSASSCNVCVEFMVVEFSASFLLLLAIPIVIKETFVIELPFNIAPDPQFTEARQQLTKRTRYKNDDVSPGRFKGKHVLLVAMLTVILLL